MSKETVPASAAPNDQNQLLDAIRDTVRSETSKLSERLDAQEAKLNALSQPQSGAQVSPQSVFSGGRAPAVQTGEMAGTSRGYSILRLLGVLCGAIKPENAKIEVGISNRLQKLYCENGSFKKEEPNSILVPFGSGLMIEGDEELAILCRQAFLAGAGPIDYSQIHWAARQGGHAFMSNPIVRQALSWETAGSGADFVPPAVQGEMIDLVRAREWMTAVGVTEIPFPPNGKITLPKITADPTHYWVGESTAITESEPSTGSVTLTAQKHGILTRVPNELFRFSMPAFEGVLRNVMAATMAQGLGSALLDGQETSARPPGLDSISGAQDLSRNTNVVTLNADGDRLKPRGPSYMAAQLAEANHDINFMSYILRPLLWDTIINLRADAVSANDGAGQYLFRVGGRDTARPERLDGHLVVPTTQVRADLESLHGTEATAGPGSSSAGSDQTALYAVIGRELVLARAGVLEFAVSIHAGTNTFAQDQSLVRVLEHVDFEAFHGDAIAYAKYLAQAW